MKKNYETPSVEVVKFQYSDQVVAQSGICKVKWTHYPDASGQCTGYEKVEYAN